MYEYEQQKWQNWSHLNSEVNESAVASEKMAIIIESATGSLQTKVNCVELKNLLDRFWIGGGSQQMLTFWSRKCFSTQLGPVSSLDLSWKSVVGCQKFQMFCVFFCSLQTCGWCRKLPSLYIASFLLWTNFTCKLNMPFVCTVFFATFGCIL